MSNASDFYLARAADCAKDADDAILTNVRERYLRAEATWRGLAEQLLHSDRVHVERPNVPKGEAA